jgi:L-ascorbate metabolism protein UlaG (beta-lactamase superfamily)
VIPAQRIAGLKVNSYILSSAKERVFFGGETRDLEPLRRYRSKGGEVDIALLPIDGSRFLGYPLVTDGAGALEAAQILGARTLVPIHYSARPVPLLLQTPGSKDKLLKMASAVPNLKIVYLEPGERFEFDSQRELTMARIP